ncbi:MAG: FAD/NAD(P)-binding protein [Vulcanimicrobiaceae bacterium]
MEQVDVAIVGAGLAGCTVAAQLGVYASPGLRVLLFDPNPPGPGNAYATRVRAHLLNGPLRAMSAMPGDEAHLTRWAGEPGDRLIERSRFGAYLSELIDRTLQDRSNVRYIQNEVIDIFPSGGGFTVVDSAGARRYAQTVVLAFGNALPGDAFLPSALRADMRYVADPWRFDGSDCAGDVLCIGSGLTAMDVAATLNEVAPVNRVHFVSRHRLLPLVEEPAARGLDPATLDLDTTSPHALLRTMRRAAREFAARGGDWRCIAESIRKDTPAIWHRWSLRERRRFLRHLQPYWSIHRYRVPPAIAEVCSEMEAQGRLVRHRGSVVGVEINERALRIAIERAGAHDEVVVHHVVNCTGPEGDVIRIDRLLIRNLLRRGLIRPDPLRLGIDATPDLRVIGSHGAPRSNLFTLGPPLRGLWYETTAVPEIRDQSALLASIIAR